MDKQTIFERLLAMPQEIEQAENTLLHFQLTVEEARRELKDKEAVLTLGVVPGMEINGKNAEQSQAQLWQFTATEREKVKKAEENLASWRVVYNRKLNDFRALREAAQLLNRGEAA
jgi:hypothetical protein